MISLRLLTAELSKIKVMGKLLLLGLKSGTALAVGSGARVDPVTQFQQLEATDLAHDSYVNYEYDDGYDEEYEQVGDPRPDGEQRGGAAAEGRLTHGTALSGRVIRPQVELHRSEQQTPDHHADRHLQRSCRRAVANFLKYKQHQTHKTDPASSNSTHIVRCASHVSMIHLGHAADE